VVAGAADQIQAGRNQSVSGGQYLLFDTYNTLDTEIDIPDFTDNEFSSTLSELSLKFELDSRNNVFSPSKGLFLGITTSYSDTWMGGAPPRK